MAQHNFAVPNSDGATFRSEINAALQALATMSLGPAAPATTYAGQRWWDTTNNLVKVRNTTNTAWVTEAGWDGTSWIPYRDGAPIPALGSAAAADIGFVQGAVAGVGVNNVIDRSILPLMVGASAGVAGAAGTVTKPAAGDNDKFLRGDAQWADITGDGIADAFLAAIGATAQNVRSFNIGSTVDLGTGNTQGTFAVAMIDGNYQVSLGYDADVPVTITGAPRIMDTPVRNASAMTVQSGGMSDSPGISAPLDFSRIFFEVNGG